MRLATFVHISDLHIGDIDPEAIVKDAVARELWAKGGPVFDGLLGHSHKSLVRLEQAYDKLRADEDAKLIVTGDLTAFGAESQFDTAADFLGQVLKPPKTVRALGLREKNWAKLAVPGNHDHWSGRPVIVGRPTVGLAKYFSGLPTTHVLPLPSGNTVRFLRIDSDADVQPFSPQRVLARGCFSTQLQKLAGELPVPQQREIRVLLIHHSFQCAGVCLAMTSQSKSALADFIVDQAVSVILCGHIHQPPFVGTMEVIHLRQKKMFLEARSGTTTQLSTLPFHWTNLVGNRPKRMDRWPNSFLVHRLIQQDDGSIDWCTETHLEGPYGFRNAPAVSGLPKEFSLKVWRPNADQN